MSYPSLLVNLNAGQDHAGILAITGGLADRFQAQVRGVMACQPLQMVSGDGAMDGELFTLDRAETQRLMDAAAIEFERLIRPHASRRRWHGTTHFGAPAARVAAQAASADLVITRAAEGSFLEPSRHLQVGDLLMSAGRPVLLVPAAAQALPLNQALVAWKPGREACRALADALPLLRRCARVTLVGLSSKAEEAETNDGLAEIAAWLALHRVAAKPLHAVALGHDGHQLQAIARDLGADLLVAGAYGHNRLHEWALGGVTRTLLTHPECCTLLSH